MTAEEIPITSVSFAIVMLGTGVERYALLVLLSLRAYVASLLLYEDYLDNRLCSSMLTSRWWRREQRLIPEMLP